MNTTFSVHGVSPRRVVSRFALVLFATCALCVVGDNAPGALMLVLRDGKAGFVGSDGVLKIAPRFAVCGAWSEGRVWVQEEKTAGTGGGFLDAEGNLYPAFSVHDLSSVRPELPLPQFQAGVAVVGRGAGTYGYIDRSGRWLGEAPPLAVMQRQEGELLLVRQQGRLGYMNRGGRIVIPARYEEATPFRGHRAAVRRDGQWALIDSQGNPLTTRPFEAVRPLSADAREWSVCLEGRWGMVTDKGMMTVEPLYDAFGPPRDGAVAVTIDGHWGLLSLEGTLRIAPQFQDLRPLYGASGGWTMQDDSGKWGMLDANGRVLAPPGYEEIGKLTATVFLARRDGLWGIVDLGGKWLLQPVCARIVPLGDPFDGLALFEQNRRWGIFDGPAGQVAMPPRHRWLDSWMQFMAAFDGRRMRLLTLDGQERSVWEGQPEGLPADFPRSAPGGLVRTSQGVTLLTAEGRMPWKRTFEETGTWSEGLLAACREERWGYVNPAGHWEVAPRFAAAGNFSEGFAAVVSDGRWGLIDRTGAWTLEPSYDELGDVWHGRVPARKGRFWGLIDVQEPETAVLALRFQGLEWGRSPDSSPRWYGFDPDQTEGLEFYRPM